MQRNGAAQCHGRKLRAIGGNHQTGIVVADMEIYDHELELVLIIPTVIGIDQAGLAVGMRGFSKDCEGPEAAEIYPNVSVELSR